MSEPKKPRRISKLERRRQLLEQARRLFHERGYAATALADVAAAAGVSEAVVARHFPTRHDLFLEFVGELRNATLEHWRAATAELTDPLARLHAKFDLFLQATRTRPDDFRVLHRALAEGGDAEAEAEAVRAYYADCEALLAQVIGEGQQSGVFRRNLDPRVGAWELIRAALGYTLTDPLGMPLHEDKDYLARSVDCLFHALVKVDV